MNNRFKFRIWDIHGKRFFNPKAYCLNLNGEVEEYHCGSFSRIVGDAIIQQFTGLKDENEKDIYEGDILRSEDAGIVKVEWRKFYSGYKFGGIYLDDKEYDFYGYIPQYCYVIGNIFENPELLKNE